MTDDDPDGLTKKIEMLVLGLKKRHQRLHKDTDGSKARARILRKLRKEKDILANVVEQYNRVVPSEEALCMETILSRDTAWPWQLQHSGMYTILLTPNLTHNYTYTYLLVEYVQSRFKRSVNKCVNGYGMWHCLRFPQLANVAL